MLETPPKKKAQVPLVCLSLKKEKAHQMKLISKKESPKDLKETKEKQINNTKNLIKCPLLIVELCLEEKQFQIEIFAKETSFDVVRRIIKEKKMEVFLGDDENIKRKKIKILAEILQKRINGFIEDLLDYVEKEKTQKFKIFKPKTKDIN